MLVPSAETDFVGDFIRKTYHLHFHTYLYFIFSPYLSFASSPRWLATTHFEPTDARAAFPCFDEPDLKANFSMSITRDTSHIALFNTESLGIPEQRKDGLVTDHFAESVKMSTYLVAFVVCDYQAKVSNAANGTIKVCNTVWWVICIKEQSQTWPELISN